MGTTSIAGGRRRLADPLQRPLRWSARASLSRGRHIEQVITLDRNEATVHGGATGHGGEKGHEAPQAQATRLP
tara:strand:+ start:298 stop:516 length:219 start_codon:yes stop_codon:yes gene_type:complete